MMLEIAGGIVLAVIILILLPFIFIAAVGLGAAIVAIAIAVGAVWLVINAPTLLGSEGAAWLYGALSLGCLLLVGYWLRFVRPQGGLAALRADFPRLGRAALPLLFFVTSSGAALVVIAVVVSNPILVAVTAVLALIGAVLATQMLFP
jgi:hypothetical protein